MKMGQDSIEETRQMFGVWSIVDIELLHTNIIWLKELESKISISLDAWTSSNQFAFLAIVAHYISNEGQLSLYLHTPLFDLMI